MTKRTAKEGGRRKGGGGRGKRTEAQKEAGCGLQAVVLPVVLEPTAVLEPIVMIPLKPHATEQLAVDQGGLALVWF